MSDDTAPAVIDVDLGTLRFALTPAQESLPDVPLLDGDPSEVGDIRVEDYQTPAPCQPRSGTPWTTS